MRRFSKTICLALLVVAMTFVLAGCKSPKQDIGDIVITAPETEVPAAVEEPAPVEEVKSEAPVEEAPAVEEPAPVVEAPAEESKEEAPAVEEPAPVVEEAQAVVSYKPVAKKYTFAGYELTVVADKGKAVIQYPSIIAKADIDAAAQAAVAAFGGVYDLSAVSYSVNEMDHVLTVYYPEEWGMDELELAEQTIIDELPGYVVAVYEALFVPEAEAEVAAEVEPEVAEAEEEIVAEEEPIVELGEISIEDDSIFLSFSVFGYEASIEIEEGKATFTYPSFITDDEIWAAAKFAYALFEQYLQGTSLEIVAPGQAILTYPTSYSEEDLEFAADILEDSIPDYVASVVAALFAEDEPVEDVAAVAEEPATEKAPAAEVEIYSSNIDLYGYEATILASQDTVVFIYPELVTNAEVRAAAEAAYGAYSQYLQGSTLEIDNGVAVLKLAYNLTEDDFDYAVDLLEKELDAYVQSLFAQAPAEEEPVEAEEVAVVAEAPAVEEAPAAEEPAPVEEAPVVETQEEAPAEEEVPVVEEPAPVEEVKEEAPVVEEPAKAEEPAKQEDVKASAPAATPAAEPAPAKKSNVGLVILIIVLVLVVAAAVVVVLKKRKN